MKPLVLASPHMKGPGVKDAQYQLQGHNRFKIKTYLGRRDGDFGPATAHAANRMRYWLGYPKGKIETNEFGQMLRSFLLPKSTKEARLLPPAYRLRRIARVKADAAKKKLAAKSKKGQALKLALSQVGTHESPWGSNMQKYGAWYGFNGVAWCAIFVSYCLSHAGIPRKTALAYQWEYWARARQNGFRITYDPEPGDIVVYHHGQGHTGLFYKWVDRSRGIFLAVEGNTSKYGSQDNGGAVEVQTRDTGWVPTVFVRVP